MGPENSGRLSAKDFPIEVFKNRPHYNIDLTPYVEKFKRQELAKNDRYLICLANGYGSYSLTRKIYFDGFYAFILFRAENTDVNVIYDKAIACIGFEQVGKTIKVVQIQGVSGKKRWLSKIRWEKMLLSILIDWAKANRYKRVEVIRAEESVWYPREWQKNRYSNRLRKSMFLRYDVTARRMGFKFVPNAKRYAKHI